MKPATTYEQQFNILTKRGLACPSKHEVIAFLKENNYYRFTGYAKLYTKPGSDNFIDGLTFDKLYNIYMFDSEMRTIINIMVAQIEVAVRTQLAYNLSNNLDPLCYKKKCYFTNNEHFKITKSIIKKDINKASDEPMIKHFGTDPIPFWVIVEIISFGVVSKLYANLQTPYKKMISSGSYFAINYEYFENFLNVCTSLRNNCAHRARLYGRIFTTAPKYSKKERIKYGNAEDYANCFITDGSGTKLFEYIYTCMKLILRKSDKKKYISMITKIINKHSDYIDLDKIGFPMNWANILDS